MISRKLYKKTAYLFSFSIARGALFFSPILLANFLEHNFYGEIEAALAKATLFSTLVALGTGGVLPLVILRNNKQATLKGIVAHHIVMCLVAFGFAGLGYIWGLSTIWLLSCIFTGVLLLQSLASAHLKTLGRVNESVFLDSGLLGLIALVSLFIHYHGLASPKSVILITVSIYAFLLLISYINRLVCLTNERLAWRSSILLGAPLMFGGFLSFFATTSGRLFMGVLGDASLMADYAILARAGALPVITYQILTIAKYRRLFESPDTHVAKAVTSIGFLVSGSVCLLIILSPWLSLVLGDAFQQVFIKHKLAFYLIDAQAILWCAIALNDLMIARNQIMHRVIPHTALFLLISLIFGYLAIDSLGLTLDKFVIVHSVVMFSFYVKQSRVMFKLGMIFTYNWIATILCYLVVVLLAFALSA